LTIQVFSEVFHNAVRKSFDMYIVDEIVSWLHDSLLVVEKSGAGLFVRLS
jgi:hypothetical protein